MTTKKLFSFCAALLVAAAGFAEPVRLGDTDTYYALYGSVSGAESLRLTILADGQPAIGTSIFINGKIKKIVDGEGKAQLTNIKYGDTIQTSYLGYKPEIVIFSSQKEKITINLIPEYFEIGEIEISSSNDMDLFKKMLKKKLKEPEIHKKTPFTIIDTLLFLSDADTVYRKCTGKFILPQRAYQVNIREVKTVSLHTNPDIVEKDDSGEEDAIFIYPAEKRDSTNSLLRLDTLMVPRYPIEGCFAIIHGLSTFDKDMRLTYLGKDSTGYEQFHFFVSDNDWIHSNARYKSYFGGIVYLNADGVIEKIKLHQTSTDHSVRSFDYDIDYVYQKKKNEVTPYRAFIQFYRLNEELEVIRSQRMCLEIYSKQAILEGKIRLNADGEFEIQN